VIDALSEVARERGLPPAQIALAWLLHKPGVVTSEQHRYVVESDPRLTDSVVLDSYSEKAHIQYWLRRCAVTRRSRLRSTY
jgi:hypothetical protein